VGGGWFILRKVTVVDKLCYTDTSMGIGYDTYLIRGYKLFKKTLIRGYG
jgi:hypothetical protein